MKRLILYIILILITAGGAISCNEWLEGTSSSQVSGKKLFSTRTGFHEALSGVYINMGGESCYGKEYTWFANDVVCYPYCLVGASGFSVWQEHHYSSSISKPVINSMWQSGYNVIANINKILLELEQRRDVIVDDTEYNLIKGELRGLRAYLYFDLMRMFGLNSWNGDNASKLTIPYVTVYSKEATPQRTYSETKELVLGDIDTAIECLKSDPVTGNVTSEFENDINADRYWSNRRLHFNYYAAKALKAKVLLWLENYAEARKLASEVIEATLAKNIVTWIDPEKHVNAISNDERDWIFSTEHIFSLEVSDLYLSLSSYFFNTNTSSGNLTVEKSVVENNMFKAKPSEGFFDGLEDIRGPAMRLKTAKDGYFLYKYYSSSSLMYEYRNKLPMITLPEMYLIMAQCYLKENNNDKVKEIITMLRKKRGVSEPRFDIGNTDNEIFMEYLKEFPGDGKLIYYIKERSRNGFDWGLLTVSPDPAGLMYPYPDEEISYGRIQEQ